LSVDDVFKTAGRILGPHLKRVPDGEPGARKGWIGFNYAGLRTHPLFEHATGGFQNTGVVPLKLRANVAPEDLVMGELGYAREAKGSYLDFKAARKAGTVPRRCKFQVCLPTPLAVTSAFFVPDSQPKAEELFEAAMVREIAVIAAAIPHRDLAIQFDVCQEMIMWDGRFTFAGGNKSEGEIIARLRRLADSVPDDVELGMHLCYGDFGGRHFVEPQDATKMTELANAISSAIARKIAWIHMPVPQERSDEAFFAPLKKLKLHRETELYLGLVHLSDGVEGTRRRMAAASKYVKRFGVATECGMGRKWRLSEIPKLMQVHADVSAQA
jgi:methionine synthase II (cobalamin-independent)